MMNIVHRMGIKAPADKVFTALTTIDGLAAWFTRGSGTSAKAGGQVGFRFLSAAGDEVGGFSVDVLELQSGHKVSWRITSGPEQWVGTDIEFLLSQQDGYTIVLFGHRKWRAEDEFMAHCSMKWATFLLSLRDLVETGKGQPTPHDVKVGNW